MQCVVVGSQLLFELDDPLTGTLLNVKTLTSKNMRNYILSMIPVVING